MTPGGGLPFEEISIAASDGLQLCGLRWRPFRRSPYHGQVLLLHGFGEHVNRHRHVAEALAVRGVAGAMFDHRGHGRSQGRRGDATRFHLYYEDVALMARALDPSTPFGLLAFSFGAQLAVSYLLRSGSRHCRCLALVAPWFRLRFKPPRWQILLARVASRIAPGLRQRTPLRPEQLSSDAALLDALAADHLAHRVISARTYLGAVACGEEALRRAHELTLPVAVWHGADDPITSPAASESFVKRVGSTDATYHLLPGRRHEPHNDLGREDFLQELACWIATRLECSRPQVSTAGQAAARNSQTH